MIKRINKLELFHEKLVSEGKVTLLNQKKHVDEAIKLNSELEEVRRDFKIKNQHSQDSAAQAVLNF